MVEEDRQTITIGKKEWHVYVDAISARLQYGAVKTQSRGRQNNEKHAGVLSTVQGRDPTIQWEAVGMPGEWKSKDGANTYTGSVMVARVFKKA